MNTGAVDVKQLAGSVSPQLHLPANNFYIKVEWQRKRSDPETAVHGDLEIAGIHKVDRHAVDRGIDRGTGGVHLKTNRSANGHDAGLKLQARHSGHSAAVYEKCPAAVIEAANPCPPQLHIQIQLLHPHRHS